MIKLRRLRPATGNRRGRADATDSHPTVAEGLGPVPDDLPRDAFFTRPLRVSDLVATTEDHPDGVRVAFVATVRDADGKRCPDIAVHARIRGPERQATGMGHTSMLGKVTFRMAGPSGTYTCRIEDVAGGALGLDTTGSTLSASLQA